MLVAATALAAPPALALEGAGARPNGIAVFAGICSSDVLTDILTSPWDTRTASIYLLTLAHSRRIATVFENLDIEVEAGIGRRFGDNTSIEGYLALGLRWIRFAWNDWLRTSVAVFPIGPSYVADLSPAKIEKDGRSANWLNYVGIEVTVAAPERPQLEMLFRLHHRSGAFGAINGSTNGADFLSIGARYRL